MGGVAARVRTGLRSRRRAALLMVLVIGVAGGATLTALAGARRADTAIDRFVSYAHPPQGVVQADPAMYDQIRHLPQVEASSQGARLIMARLDDSGRPHELSALNEIAVVDNMAFSRPIVVLGRSPRAASVTDVAINPSAAKNSHLKIGSTIRLQAFDPAAAQQLLRGTTDAPTGPIVTVRVVGVERSPADLTATAATPGVNFSSDDNVYLTPAFFHTYGDRVAVAGGVLLSFRLKGGPAAVAGFQSTVNRLSAGRASVFPGSDDLDKAGKARHATSLEALALLSFGILAALVTSTLIAQALARQVHLDASEYPALRAMGMTRAQLVTVAAVRAALVGAVGAALALGVAIAASPLMPIGLARQAEVHPGYSVDGPVLMAGALAIVGSLTGWALVVARRATAVGERAAGATAAAGGRPSRLAGSLSRAGFSPSATIGARMALEPGRGATAVPVRTALISAVVAVGVVVATLTFGTNLTRLADTPRLQGWNWDVTVGNPHSDDVAATAIPALAANPTVAGFSSIAGPQGIPAQIDGHDLGLFGIDSVKGSVLPPYTAGRPPRGPDEIAFGAKTLTASHHHIGDRVSVSTGGPARTMVITGRLILTPSVVNDSVPLGQAAVVTLDAIHALHADAPVSVFLVRFAPGVGQAAAIARLRGDFPGSVLTAVPPVDIENLRRVDRLPILLAVLFSVVAVLTVGHTLVSSVRRRRRDLAVLRAVGFVGRQVSAAVAWHATIVATVAIVVGLPLGAAAGRWTWTLVTNRLGLPPDPVVPVSLLLVVVPLSLVIANVIAAFPGFVASRTRPALVLRSE